jgi:phenylalanyl-tRNA synthetase alpha subunit
VENFQRDLVNERSRSQRVEFASEASTSQTEKALEEHEKLVQEKKKLMKYIVVTKSKTEKELGSLQKQLQDEKEQASFLSAKVDILSESQAEAENTSKHLREQLEASFGKVIHPFLSFHILIYFNDEIVNLAKICLICVGTAICTVLQKILKKSENFLGAKGYYLP